MANWRSSIIDHLPVGKPGRHMVRRAPIWSAVGALLFVIVAFTALNAQVGDMIEALSSPWLPWVLAFAGAACFAMAARSVMLQVDRQQELEEKSAKERDEIKSHLDDNIYLISRIIFLDRSLDEIKTSIRDNNDNYAKIIDDIKHINKENNGDDKLRDTFRRMDNHADMSEAIINRINSLSNGEEYHRQRVSDIDLDEKQPLDENFQNTNLKKQYREFRIREQRERVQIEQKMKLLNEEASRLMSRLHQLGKKKGGD